MAVNLNEAQPSISIAMCTFNGELYLEQQLQSFSDQSLLPSELVVCDDRSTDRTLEILRSFADRAKFKVRIYQNEERLGPTSNFEKCIRLCEHELIALSDQDDVWLPHKLETLASLLSDHEALGGVFTDGVLIGQDGVRDSRTLWESFQFTRRDQARFVSGHTTESLIRRNSATGMTMIFRASLRPLLLPIPQSWIHDAWIALMLSLHSTIGLCPERLVSYRMHASQVVGTSQPSLQKLKWIRRNGIRAFFDRARKKSIVDYAINARRFNDLADYLRVALPSSQQKLILHVQDKARFSGAMSNALSQRGFRRFREVLYNVTYFHKSSPVTFRSVVRDLIA